MLLVVFMFLYSNIPPFATRTRRHAAVKVMQKSEFFSITFVIACFAERGLPRATGHGCCGPVVI